MLNETAKALITLIIGGFLGGLVKSSLDYRSKVFSLLWDKRLESYQALVKLMDRFPLWPKADPYYSDLLHMSTELKNWYFGTGGILMSKSTRVGYENLQQSITGIYQNHKNEPSQYIIDSDYISVQQLCHLLRVEMTRDLLSRKKQF